MNKSFLILQDGYEGGAPKMGREIHSILEDNGIKNKLINLSDIVEFAYLKSITSSLTSYEAKVFLVYEFLKNQNNNYDIVIVNSSRAGYAVTAAKSFGLIVYFYLHEGPEQLSIEMHQRNMQYMDLVNADYILNASRLSINYLLSIDVEEKLNKKLFLLEPFSNFDLNERNNKNYLENSLEANFKKKFKKIVGACGTCCRRKGTDRFLLMAKKMPELGFIWAGSTSYILQEFGDNFFTDIKNTENIFLLDHLDNLNSFYLNIDLLIHFCREDPSPLVSWEAASLRVPQIAFSDEIGNPELISKNGFLIYGSFNLELITEIVANTSKDLFRHPLPKRSNFRLKGDFEYDLLELLKINKKR